MSTQKSEIGQIIATYAINPRIEREQLREFTQQLTQALERVAQENTSTTSIARHFERNMHDLERYLHEQDNKLQKQEQQHALFMHNKEHTMMLAPSGAWQNELANTLFVTAIISKPLVEGM